MIALMSEPNPLYPKLKKLRKAASAYLKSQQELWDLEKLGHRGVELHACEAKVERNELALMKALKESQP